MKKTVDSVNCPKDRDRTLFHVDFLFDSIRKGITRRCPDQVTGIASEEPRLATSDNPFKVGLLTFHQRRQKELRI
jgi:hypothetical protein